MLNSFKGMEVALSKALGTFCWGVPQQMLAQSLTWISKTNDASIRSRFPSWSWEGWIFEDGSSASYSTTIHGPHPGFVIFSDESEMVYWNSDCWDNPCIGINDWHDLLLYPEDP
jgi:hypothetical protein